MYKHVHQGYFIIAKRQNQVIGKQEGMDKRNKIEYFIALKMILLICILNVKNNTMRKTVTKEYE